MAEQAATAEDTEAKKSGGMMKTVVSGVAIFVIVLAAQTVAPLISSKLGLAPPVMAPNEAAEAGAGDAETVSDAAPIYWPLKPAMVVNFAGAGDSSFLQVEMEVMARDQAVIDQVKEHTPAIRNSLLLLLASQTDDAVFTIDGKKGLLAAALAEINQCLEPYTDEKEVEAVYFTSFVAQ